MKSFKVPPSSSHPSQMVVVSDALVDKNADTFSSGSFCNIIIIIIERRPIYKSVHTCPRFLHLTFPFPLFFFMIDIINYSSQE